MGAKQKNIEEREVRPNQTPISLYSEKECHKGNKSISNPKYQRILNLFLTGGKYTVIQLTEILQIADTRSLIRRMRNDSIPISDYWQKSELSRFKVYFLHTTGLATDPTNTKESCHEEIE